MPLNEQDREWVRLMAAQLAREVNQEVLRVHVLQCPHGQLIQMTKSRIRSVLLGAGLGMVLAGLVGGSTAALLMKLLATL